MESSGLKITEFKTRQYLERTCKDIGGNALQPREEGQVRVAEVRLTQEVRVLQFENKKIFEKIFIPTLTLVSRAVFLLHFIFKSRNL